MYNGLNMKSMSHQTLKIHEASLHLSHKQYNTKNNLHYEKVYKTIAFL